MNAKSLLCIMAHIILGLTTVSFLSILIISCLNNNTDFGYLESLSTNWGNNYVEEVFSGYLNSNNFEKMCYPLILNKWEGTVGGCSVDNEPSLTCPKYSIILKTVGAKTYYFWRQAKMCSTRSKISYFYLTIAENEESCPSDTRSCGLIDTLSNVLCLPLDTPCPPNYFEILPSDQPLPTGFEFETIQINQANIIISNTNTKGKILTEFQITEGEPCIDPNFTNNAGPLYLLEKGYKNPGCKNSKNIDKTYDLKDTYSYFAVYFENGILSAMNNLPRFGQYEYKLSNSNRKMKLYSRNYIGISNYCLNIIKSHQIGDKLINEMSSLSSKLNGLGDAYLGGSVFGSICFGIAFITMIVLWVCWCRYGLNRVDDAIFVAYFVSSILTSFILLIVGSVILTKFSVMGTTFDILLKSECPNEDSLSNLQLFANLKNQNIVASAITITASSLSLLLLIINLVYLRIKA